MIAISTATCCSLVTLGDFDPLRRFYHRWRGHCKKLEVTSASAAFSIIAGGNFTATLNNQTSTGVETCDTVTVNQQLLPDLAQQQVNPLSPPTGQKWAVGRCSSLSDSKQFSMRRLAPSRLARLARYPAPSASSLRLHGKCRHECHRHKTVTESCCRRLAEFVLSTPR